MSPTYGHEVRARTTTAAYVPSQHALDGPARKSSRPESPLTQACKSGSSKACNELGDRLALKHAQAEARHWYETSCERVLTAMVPTATRLMQLSRDLTQLANARSDDDRVNAFNQRKLTALKSDASEIRASIQGCFDTGDTLTLEQELKLSLKYYDAACEFSTLVDAVGEAVPGLEHATESGCEAGRAARARLNDEAPFSPQLFADLTQPHPQVAAVKRSAPQAEPGMVFSEGDL